MALSHFDGFEGYATFAELLTNGWADAGFAVNTCTFSTTTPRSGNVGMAVTSTTAATNFVYRSISAQQSGFAGFGIRRETPTTPGDAVIFQIRDTANIQLALRFNSADNSLSLLLNATVIATSSANVLPTTANWYFIECGWTIDNTAGVFTLTVDDVSVFNLTGIDTQASANATYNRVGLANIVTGTTNASLRFDDFYLGDPSGSAPYNAKLGNIRVLPLKPDADTAVQWTKSAGTTNFGNVNKSTVATTPNNLSATVGQIDKLGTADLSYTPATIFAVKTLLSARKSDAGARTIRSKLWSGATTSDGVSVSPATTDAFFQDEYLNDPNTGAAWTAAAVNALEIGYEVVT